MGVDSKKIKALDKTIEYLERMISACKEMQNGVSENVVCKKYDLDSEMFSNTIRKEWKYNSNLFARTKCCRGYYINWRDFFCYTIYGDSIKPLEDFDESFNMALSALTDVEKNIVIRYFKDGVTFTEMAKERGITPQGLRVSYNSACSKLRDSRVRDYFRLGLKVVQKSDENIFLRKQRDEISAMLDMLEKENVSLRSNISEMQAKIDSYGVLEARKFPLDGVSGISRRLYNALKRNNIQYLDEVLIHNKDWFMRLRNFGKQSLNELEEVTKSLGLHFKE